VGAKDIVGAALAANKIVGAAVGAASAAKKVWEQKELWKQRKLWERL
jgi:hypothetical protein